MMRILTQLLFGIGGPETLAAHPNAVAELDFVRGRGARAAYVAASNVESDGWPEIRIDPDDPATLALLASLAEHVDMVYVFVQQQENGDYSPPERHYTAVRDALAGTRRVWLAGGEEARLENVLREMVRIRAVDPDAEVSAHNPVGNQTDEWFDTLVGHPDLDGLCLQIAPVTRPDEVGSLVSRLDTLARDRGREQHIDVCEIFGPGGSIVNDPDFYAAAWLAGARTVLVYPGHCCDQTLEFTWTTETDFFTGLRDARDVIAEALSQEVLRFMLGLRLFDPVLDVNNDGAGDLSDRYAAQGSRN